MPNSTGADDVVWGCLPPAVVSATLRRPTPAMGLGLATSRTRSSGPSAKARGGLTYRSVVPTSPGRRSGSWTIGVPATRIASAAQT